MKRISGPWLGMLEILAAAILWGTSGAFAKYLFNNNISPYDLAQARLSLSFVILIVFVAIFNRKLLRVEKKDLGFLALFGIGGLALVQFTYMFTISVTNVATAIFLQYLAPGIILLYGLIRRTEHVSSVKLTALTLSLLGGFLIVKGTVGGLGLEPIGALSGLGSAIAFSFYTIYGKYGLKKYNAWTLLTWGVGFGALAWWLYQPPFVLIARYDITSWLQFLYIAVMATVLPFGLYFMGLKKLSAFRANLIATLEPVVGAFAAYLFLGERLNSTQGFGSSLVLLSVVVIQLAAKNEEVIIHKGVKIR